MAPVKIGIIGVGRIGQVHAKSIQSIPSATVVMISDIWEEGAKKACETFNIPRWTKDPNELINDPEVEAVLICSPTDQHADQIIACAKAGKFIFCEKPISLNVEIIDEVCKVIDETNAKCMVAFQRRFDPTFRRLRDAVETGEVGDVHMVHIVSRDPGPPPIAYIAQSGGLHCDMAIHDFDMARFIVGSEVIEVYAKGECRVDNAIAEAGDIDTSLVVLKFANGAIATVSNSRKATYGYDQRVEVFGSKGMIQSNNLFHNQCTLSLGDAVKQDLPMNFFMDRYKDAYLNEMIAFVEMCTTNSPPPCGVTEGRNAAKISVAAKQSMDSNLPVQL